MMRNSIAQSTRITNTRGRIALTFDQCVRASDDGQTSAEQMSADAARKVFGN